MTEHAETQVQVTRRLLANKDTLFDTLSASDVARIVVTFDGQSDTGQVESVEAETADGGSTLLPRGTMQYRGPEGAAGEPVLDSLDVRDGVEAVVYDYLDWTHAGWEDNEGAEGVFTFEVKDRVVRVRVRERLGGVAVPEVEF